MERERPEEEGTAHQQKKGKKEQGGETKTENTEMSPVRAQQHFFFFSWSEGLALESKVSTSGSVSDTMFEETESTDTRAAAKRSLTTRIIDMYASCTLLGARTHKREGEEGEIR